MANQRQGQMPRASYSRPSQRPSRQNQNDRNNRRTGNQPEAQFYDARHQAPPAMPPPLYELPDMITLMPDQKYNYINFDFSGYITLCEASYRNLNLIESRFTRQITLGTFLHVMNGYLWARLYRLASLFEITLPFEPEILINIVGGDEAIIPSEIHDYLKNIGQFKDGFGDIWRPNFPDIMVLASQQDQIPGGHFGPPTPANHNIYETCPAPYTTAERARREIQGQVNFVPLPAGIMPDVLHYLPTENLVGYADLIVAAHPEARARMQHARFDQDPVGSRICHSSDFRNALNTALRSLESKTRLSYGIPNNIEGTTSAIGFVKTNVANSPLALLRDSPLTVMGRSLMSKAEIGQACLFAFRRYREAATPGLSFLQLANRNPPPGWMDTINNSFDSVPPFDIIIGDHDDVLDHSAFQLTSAGTSRTSIVNNWVQFNFRRE